MKNKCKNTNSNSNSASVTVTRPTGVTGLRVIKFGTATSAFRTK